MARRNAVRRPSSAAAVEALEDRKLMSTVVALSGAGTLLFVDSAAPDQTLAKIRVRGLQRREALVGIDFRTANNQLYGVGSTSRIYQIDLTTGQATAINPTGEVFEPGLGTAVETGIDFNPRVDRLRVTTDNDVNLRVDPNNGLTVDSDTTTPSVQPDQTLAYLAGDPGQGRDPTVVAVAYDNTTLSTNTADTTTLFGIDSGLNSLVLIGSNDGAVSPNTGRLTTVGALGVDPISVAGFDIETIGTTDTGYAAFATADRGRSSLYTVDLATGASTSLGEVRGSRGPVRDIAVVPAGNRILAVDGRNRLYTFSSTLPTVVNSRLRITGLARSERVLGIDVRPATGAVYAYTSQNRLYTLDAGTGAATSVGTPTAGITLNRRATAGVDFNPAVDRLRVVGSTGENLRLDPGTGAVVDGDPSVADTQGDAALAFATGGTTAGGTPTISGAAYTNNVAGGVGTPATTVLYGIDAGTDALVTIGSADGTTTSPNTGQVFTVGTLGVDVRDVTGFDIVTATTTDTATPPVTTATNAALATFRERRGGVGLYSIDLTSGAATRLANLGRGVSPIGIAILQTVAPATPPVVPTTPGTGGSGTGTGT